MLPAQVRQVDAAALNRQGEKTGLSQADLTRDGRTRMRSAGILPREVGLRHGPLCPKPGSQLPEGDILEANIAAPLCRRRVRFRLPVGGARTQCQLSDLSVPAQVRPQFSPYAPGIPGNPQPGTGEDRRNSAGCLLKDQRRIFQDKLVDRQLGGKPEIGRRRSVLSFGFLSKRIRPAREQARNRGGRFGIGCRVRKLDARLQDKDVTKEQLST